MTPQDVSVYVPHPVPTNLNSHNAAPPSARLEKEQTLLCDRVLEHLVSAADYTIIGINQEGDALIMDKMFLGVIYLRATDWNADAVIKRLENTLKWGREFGIYDKIVPEHNEGT